MIFRSQYQLNDIEDQSKGEHLEKKEEKKHAEKVPY